MRDFEKHINAAVSYVNDENSFYSFVNLLEAVVAFHKKYGGK
jgi:CRISPR/Cas system CSM-associated protein Csm2 small subunit